MPTLIITPFSSGGTTENSDLPVMRGALTTQQIAITGSTSQSAAVPATARYVDLTTDTDCIVWLGADPTAAAATGIPIWAKTRIQLAVPVESCKVAVKTI